MNSNKQDYNRANQAGVDWGVFMVSRMEPVLGLLRHVYNNLDEVLSLQAYQYHPHLKVTLNIKFCVPKVAIASMLLYLSASTSASTSTRAIQVNQCSVITKKSFFQEALLFGDI